MKPHQLEPLFNPTSVAVLGASDDTQTVGGRLFSNLLHQGFSGTVYPVNPKHERVGAKACYPSLSAIRNQIDLAVIATPSETVADIIRECGDCDIPAAVVLSAGFGETGARGKRTESRLAEVARQSGVRFIGPNCLGVMRPDIGMNATFLSSSAPAGRLALVSQSGALCAAIVDWAEPNNLGLSSIVSLGNATDIGFGDVLDYLSVDSKTDAILLYVEGIRDARSFMSGLRVAARVKPVIVLKAGRHEHGTRAASTHSGALIGSDEVFDAALERAGVVRAMSFGQLFAAAEILATEKRTKGNRVAIITNGGGAGVLAADRAEDLSMEMPKPTDEAMATLDKILPGHWSHANPIDILGDADAAIYRQVIELALKDKNNDGVIVMLTPQAMSEPDAVANAVIEAIASHRAKPLLACFMGQTQVAEARRKISAKGIPDFTTPERAVDAFSYLARYRMNQELLLQTPGPLSDDRKPPDIEGARLIIETALSAGRTLLSDWESKAVLSAFHIACSQTIEVESAAEALVAAETLGFPVAMKISSPQISHKSDVGGVRTNLMSGAEVHSAFELMVSAVKEKKPESDVRGVTVEPMVSGADIRELMVGVKSDAVFGPVISFGAGGTMAEIIQDTAVAIPPLNRILASRLIDSSRIAKLLGRFRNMDPIDRAATEDVLLRLSDLVCELPHVAELDINPLLASEGGVIAVDARIKLHHPQISPVPFAHMAIHPYPSDLASTSFLPDGAELTIRPIRPEDAEMEQAFVRSLSAEAKYFRFMQNITELTPKMLVRFTQIDYSREMALIAVVKKGRQKKQIGVARYVINPDGQSCEFAIVVSDERQRQGIGSRLMQQLMQAARRHGLKSIEGIVLADNARMMKLMKNLGFSSKVSPDDAGLRVVERWL